MYRAMLRMYKPLGSQAAPHRTSQQHAQHPSMPWYWYCAIGSSVQQEYNLAPHPHTGPTGFMNTTARLPQTQGSSAVLHVPSLGPKAHHPIHDQTLSTRSKHCKHKSPAVLVQGELAPVSFLVNPQPIHTATVASFVSLHTEDMQTSQEVLTCRKTSLSNHVHNQAPPFRNPLLQRKLTEQCSNKNSTCHKDNIAHIYPSPGAILDFAQYHTSLASNKTPVCVNCAASSNPCARSIAMILHRA